MGSVQSMMQNFKNLKYKEMELFMNGFLLDLVSRDVCKCKLSYCTWCSISTGGVIPLSSYTVIPQVNCLIFTSLLTTPRYKYRYLWHDHNRSCSILADNIFLVFQYHSWGNSPPPKTAKRDCRQPLVSIHGTCSLGVPPLGD